MQLLITGLLFVV